MASPATSLPPEICAEIFGELARDAHAAYVRSLRHQELRGDPEDPRPYSWIGLTHVCRVWRWVALSTPALWADICIINADATQEFVARSANQDLTVTFRKPVFSLTVTKAEINARMEAYGSILIDHIQRVTSLIVPAGVRVFSSEIVAAAKHLRTLIMLTLDVDPPSTDIDGPPLAFPALEHFEYRAAFFSPLSYRKVLCSSLTTLVLRPDWMNISDVDETSYDVHLPTAGEIVRAVATMPRLERLDVQLADSVLALTQTAELPHLHDLCVTGATAALAQLLAHIVPSATVRLAPDCRHPDEDAGADVLPVPPAIARALADAPNPPYALCSAFSITDTRGYYVLHGWRRARDLTHPFVRADADLALTCPCLDAPAALAALLRPFTLGAVAHVRVGRAPWHLPSGVSETALCAHAGLKSLVLDSLTPPRALQLLETTAAPSVALVAINFKPADPAKQALWLNSWSRAIRPVTFDEPSSAMDLAEILATRAKEGRPLQLLRILRVQNIVAADVEALRAHVGELEWDGIEADSLDPADNVM